MLTRLAQLGLRAPKRVLGLAGLLLVLAAIVGGPVASHLEAGGFSDPASDSSRAETLLDGRLHGGQPNLLFLVRAPEGVNSAAARTAGTEITHALAARTDWVTTSQSYWTVPKPAAHSLLSRDGRQGLVVAHLRGNDNQVQDRAGKLAALAEHHPGVQVIAGGSSLVNHQVTVQTKADLEHAEAIAIPITALALILVFGSLVAALLPLAIGIFAIVATLAILRTLATFTDVSIYAMNMTTALGLALAIDYSLFVVSRYREELQTGADVSAAVVATMRTAGRTVLFSALTVALSLSALAIFPVYFLRSFAYAGVAVVAFAALASIAVLPALLALIGTRINALDLRVGLRRLLRRPARPTVTVPLERGRWYRIAHAVMRRPVVFGVAVAALFLVLGAPFLRAAFGYPDDRILTSGYSSRAVGDALRTDFAQDSAAQLVGVAPAATAGPGADYATRVSEVPGVQRVISAAGTFAHGKQVAAGTGSAAIFTVDTDVDPYSGTGKALVRHVRDVPAPWQVLYTGAAAVNVDSIASISAKLPLALGLIALATLVVLFLFTGSVVLPLKALVLNMLSLTATFGAMVWIFQDGHLSGLLGFTATGYLVANMVILMFCMAFGMSMDYEVFLLSRIREAWLRSDATHAANEEAVAVGLGRTGRIVTAAALLMSIVFAAMIGSHVAFMQLFGLGLTLAVLADATLVRGVLVPAFMKLMGRRNWWAPRPLARLHDRIGLHEAPAVPTARPELVGAR